MAVISEKHSKVNLFILYDKYYCSANSFIYFPLLSYINWRKYRKIRGNKEENEKEGGRRGRGMIGKATLDIILICVYGHSPVGSALFPLANDAFHNSSSLHRLRNDYPLRICLVVPVSVQSLATSSAFYLSTIKPPEIAQLKRNFVEVRRKKC